MPTSALNRYITERPYLSTQIFSLKISRAKAELSSAYLKFSLALNWWDVKINPGAAGKIHLRGLQSAHKSVQM